MRKHAPWVLVLFGAVTATGRAQTPAPDSPIDEIGWLVGTWTAEASRPDGTIETTEVTYQWAGHKRAIRYSLHRKSSGSITPALEGICGWHPGKKQLVLWEVDEKGNLTEGVLNFGGGEQRHEEVIYGVDGSVLPVRAEVLRKDEDAFQFNAAVEKDGQWTVVFERTYRRVRR